MISIGSILRIIESRDSLNDIVLKIEEIKEIENNPKIGLRLKLSDEE